MIGLACALPLLAGVVLLASGTKLSARAAARVGAGSAALTLLLVITAWASGTAIDLPWLPALGLRLHLGLDGISGPLAALACLVTATACVTLVADRPRGGNPATLVGCLLLTLAGAVATFAARDAVLFVIAFEMVLVPMWVLITRFGDEREPGARQEAGARFVIYTGIGSTLMLLGVLLLVSRSGTSDLATLAAAGGEGLGSGVQTVIAVLLVLGLAVKVPVWPLHSWLPLAHTSAPTAGSMVLAAVLLKMGTYGLVRLPLATVPEGFARLAPVLAVCGVVGILWAGLVCLVERELKRLIAWSSIGHMGFVALALASGSATGVVAALYGNIAHGAISALLFLLVGGLRHRWEGDDLTIARAALRERAPLTGLLLLTGLAAGLGLPGLAGFWGEFPAIIAALDPAGERPLGLFVGCAAAAAAGAALAAAYSLRVARLVWLGEGHESAKGAAPPPVAPPADTEPDEQPESGDGATRLMPAVPRTEASDAEDGPTRVLPTVAPREAPDAEDGPTRVLPTVAPREAPDAEDGPTRVLPTVAPRGAPDAADPPSEDVRTSVLSTTPRPEVPPAGDEDSSETGDTTVGPSTRPSDELSPAQLVPGALLAAAVVVLGVAPGLLLAVTDPALASVVTR